MDTYNAPELQNQSPSSRRAWIEIICSLWTAPRSCVALLAEGVDRNYLYRAGLKDEIESPSSRRAWIEIRPGCRSSFFSAVALLAEGVDRNRDLWRTRSSATVALLAEGVDRNEAKSTGTGRLNKSPSSRRAWIEI